jgi:hypothetical protein
MYFKASDNISIVDNYLNLHTYVHTRSYLDLHMYIQGGETFYRNFGGNFPSSAVMKLKLTHDCSIGN